MFTNLGNAWNPREELIEMGFGAANIQSQKSEILYNNETAYLNILE